MTTYTQRLLLSNKIDFTKMGFKPHQVEYIKGLVKLSFAEGETKGYKDAMKDFDIVLDKSMNPKDKG